MITKKKIKRSRTVFGLCGLAMTALMLFASCNKESASQNDHSSSSDLLTFVPNFRGVTSSSPETMTLIDPNFTSKLEFDMGLFICDNNATYSSSDYHAHAAGYFNMKGHCLAERVSSTDPATYTWTFTPSNTTIPYSEAGVRLAPGATVDVYAYTPYTNATITNPKHIPYVASQDDYMYCEPKIGVSSGSVNMELKHAMTCFSFRIYSTIFSNVVLKKIKITPANSNVIIASGDFDATTGVVTPDNYSTPSEPLYVLFDSPVSQNTPDVTTFDVIIPPIEDYHDNEIEVSLIFSPNTELLTPITIPVSSATFEDGKYKFKKGYRYIYEICIDNYGKFKPLGFEEWGPTPDQTVHVDI